METITQINNAEAERRDRARKYEEALNLRVRAHTSITRLQQKADAYAKQVAILDAMLEQAPLLDPTIDVSVTQLVATIAGSVRGNVIAILTKARADQQRRLDDANKNLASAQGDLQRAEQVIADLG
jgi:hypothetical protein